MEVVPGRYLIALIGSRYTENEPVRWLGSAFRPPAFHKSARTHRLAGWLRSIKRSDGYFDLPVSHYPPMVSFKDMNDSATVFQVEPDAVEGVFGPGVNLKSFSMRSNMRNCWAFEMSPNVKWYLTVAVRLSGYVPTFKVSSIKRQRNYGSVHTVFCLSSKTHALGRCCS